MTFLARTKLLLVDSGPAQTIDGAALLGYAGVELALSDERDFSESDSVSRISERCRLAGLSLAVHAPSMDLRLDSSNAGIRLESVRQICESIKLFGDYASYITFHTGYARRFAKSGSLERVVSSLRLICATAAQSEVHVAIENVYESSVDELLNYFDLVESPWLKLTFDVAHAYSYGKPLRPDTIMRVMADKITGIHLSDNAGQDDQHLALGEGTLPIIPFLKHADKLLPQIGFTVEAKNKRDAARSAAFLRNASDAL